VRRRYIFRLIDIENIKKAVSRDETTVYAVAQKSNGTLYSLLN
jgi:hypothetical protein